MDPAGADDARDARPQPPPTSPPPDPDVVAVLADPALLWATVLSTSGEYIAVVDGAGIIRSCNRVDDGYSPDDVVGHSLVQFNVPESAAALERTLGQVLADGVPRTLETTVRRPDGSLNYFALRLAPLRRAGRIVAALVCSENVRPLKASEQALTRERTILRRLLEIQEQERQLVSYEIHDGLAQYLAGALLHLQAHAHAVGDDALPADFAAGLRLLETAAAEARRLIGGLRPPALDELGIVDAIEALVVDARADVPQVEFVHHLPDARLPAQLETIVFRIVQEALSNVRKHAAARSVAVTLERDAGHVRVRVRDDGRGFAPESVPDDRFGLEGIRRRCQLLGGDSRVTSTPGGGTTVEASLPIPQAH